MTRDFLTIESCSDRDLSTIYQLSTSPFDDETLKGQGVALVFERPSLRTRASSSAAVHELGGYATFFSDDEIGLDRRESAEDVARTLAETYAIAALRLRRHDVFARMKSATGERLSLINLLSDVAHPAQAVADVLTIADEFADGDVAKLAGLEVGYVGDATNVARSLSVALLRLGVNVRVASPEGYGFADGLAEDPTKVRGPGHLSVSRNATEAVRGAHVVYTDAWVSMGFEKETAQRRQDFLTYRIDGGLVELADDAAIVLHCLPAHRGDEISDEVLDGERSRVWRQVFRRRSAMTGVLRWIKGEE